MVRQVFIAGSHFCFLPARLMGLEEAWNHQALFDYMDRWMKKFGSAGIPNATEPTPIFITNMWKAYGGQAATVHH